MLLIIVDSPWHWQNLNQSTTKLFNLSASNERKKRISTKQSYSQISLLSLFTQHKQPPAREFIFPRNSQKYSVSSENSPLPIDVNACSRSKYINRAGKKVERSPELRHLRNESYNIYARSVIGHDVVFVAHILHALTSTECESLQLSLTDRFHSYLLSFTVAQLVIALFSARVGFCFSSTRRGAWKIGLPEGIENVFLYFRVSFVFRRWKVGRGTGDFRCFIRAAV